MYVRYTESFFFYSVPKQISTLTKNIFKTRINNHKRIFRKPINKYVLHRYKENIHLSIWKEKDKIRHKRTQNSAYANTFF